MARALLVKFNLNRRALLRWLVERLTLRRDGTYPKFAWDGTFNSIVGEFRNLEIRNAHRNTQDTMLLWFLLGSHLLNLGLVGSLLVTGKEVGILRWS